MKPETERRKILEFEIVAADRETAELLNDLLGIEASVYDDEDEFGAEVTAKENDDDRREETEKDPDGERKRDEFFDLFTNILGDTYDLGWNAALFCNDAIPQAEHLIYSDPATIVFWEDGTKTVVKCDNEPFSEEHGLAMAYMRKIFPSRTAFKKLVASAAHTEKKSPKKNGGEAAGE